jgi:hypothetical protein
MGAVLIRCRRGAARWKADCLLHLGVTVLNLDFKSREALRPTSSLTVMLVRPQFSTAATKMSFASRSSFCGCVTVRFLSFFYALVCAHRGQV